MCLDCNNDFVELPSGTNGTNGQYGGYSSKWLFESSVSTPPSLTKVRFNNTTYSLVTQIFVNETNADNKDMSAFLATFDDTDNFGYLRIFKEFDSSTFINFKLTAIGDSGTYRTLTVTYINNNGTFAADDKLVLSFSQSGNNGTNGANGLTPAATSITSVNLATLGASTTITFDQSSTGFLVGSRVRVSGSANPTTQYFEGVITNIAGTSITISAINVIVGSGTYTSWNIICTGDKGTSGSDASIPVGVIMDYTATSAPTNWLFANGAAISRTTYATLFALVGITYGAGDGATTFNLPDLKRRVRIGYDAGTPNNPTPSTPGEENYGGLNNKGGNAGVTLAKGNIPAHVHKVETTPGAEGGGITVSNAVGNAAHSLVDTTVNVTAGGGTDVPDTWTNSNTTVTSTVTGTTGNGTLDGLKTSPDIVENRTKYIVLYPIIKVL